MDSQNDWKTDSDQLASSWDISSSTWQGLASPNNEYFLLDALCYTGNLGLVGLIWHLTLPLLVATFAICWQPLQVVWTQIRTDIMSVLIWIQTVWHSDSVPEKKWFWKKSADDNKSMKHYPTCKELMSQSTAMAKLRRSVNITILSLNRPEWQHLTICMLGYFACFFVICCQIFLKKK